MAELAGIVRKGTLVSRGEWEKQVAELKSATNAATMNENLLKKHLGEKLTEAVAKRLPKKKFGIMFSGGVDSSLIAFVAKKLGGSFTCYSVGMASSRDVEEAKKAAKLLQLQLKCKIYSLEEAETVIKKSAAVVGEANVVNAGVAAVEIAVAELAKKDKISVFFGGLGSEEIFAGYQRHAEAENVNEECWSGLRNMRERDLVRDSKVAAAMKISFLTPFLDKELIVAAMQIPGKCKISSSGKKIILRETAAEMGLPPSIAFRKKLAAQYGSGFDKAMEKLARKRGFRHKKEYLESLL